MKPDILITYSEIAKMDSCKHAAEEYLEAEKVLNKCRNNLQLVFKKSPEWKAIRSLTTCSDGPSHWSDKGAVVTGEHSFKGGINWDFSGAQKSTYIDPKTLNTLINGKLLTEEEKRKLLQDQGILLAGAPNDK